ncbi:RING finger domain-containing protein [Nannizzia gypsea CBS 118893]|uniref:RING finger domain-containing protein n=1 Tax=Arthroderma gypseum (strain ATCC MYA-4604 / CBS 118893) TaxID=535722 RepID=E5QZM9_ARTGP|nr:RING finger domain-containing protein [Nannizzia gypsea CBS 118893]EFQ98180.1 RING finger domain-containing protein [Nannizzia gypsea CBS 118893]
MESLSPPPITPSSPPESSHDFSTIEHGSQEEDIDQGPSRDEHPVENETEEPVIPVCHGARIVDSDSDDVAPNIPVPEGMTHILSERELEAISINNELSTSNMFPTGLATSANENDLRKCWICYTDESEDSPLNTEWRSPCPCALSAHEACLLDWLADMENTEGPNVHQEGAMMLCPQCKSEIHMSRPHNLILDLARKCEGTLNRLVLPGVAFTLVGTVWAGCCAHGVYSMYLIFGRETTIRLLEEAAQGPFGIRLNLGLPLIPISLMFSRTQYADSLLPVIPVLFFAAHHPYHQEMDLQLWPPSASMTFAALPYIKSLYNLLYKRLFGDLEKKWISTVRTRINADEDNVRGPRRHRNAQNGQAEGEVIMEIELQMGIGANDGQNGEEEEDTDDNGHQVNQVMARRQGDVLRETTNLADIILGALVFPAISAGMGGLLKLALPKAWTTPPLLYERGRPWFLQTRWGRSVIGGCAFILLKDAFLLYCRYKRARLHTQRVILNYDKKTKKPVFPR